MKKYSLKFWIIFWTIAGIFLFGWFFYWNTKSKGVSDTVSKLVFLLPIEKVRKNEIVALSKIAESLVFTSGKEKTFLVLFQNNLELRPGGGFLGAFGILKIKDGKVVSLETHDLSNFDAKIPNVLEAPYPIAETMGTKFWKMRDSNFSPDFETNAKMAKKFFELSGEKEKFDGVIGITANMLTSLLKATGPIQIEGYPGTYDSQNAIIALEYQVEKAFEEQGIEREERKSVINDLALEIKRKIFNLTIFEKTKLAKILLENLSSKDIQLYFENSNLEKTARDANWAGAVDQNWNGDYLMLIDANLGAFKRDYYIKRTIEYSIDFSQNQPLADLEISYQHTAKQKDWMTRNYLTYLRVYVPEGSQLTEVQNFDDPQIGNEFGKTFFGSIVTTAIADSKIVKIEYELPKSIDSDRYSLEIQKQAGLENIPVKVKVISKNGKLFEHQYNMDSDLIVQN